MRYLVKDEATCPSPDRSTQQCSAVQRRLISTNTLFLEAPQASASERDRSFSFVERAVMHNRAAIHLNSGAIVQRPGSEYSSARSAFMTRSMSPTSVSEVWTPCQSPTEQHCSRLGNIVRGRKAPLPLRDQRCKRRVSGKHIWWRRAVGSGERMDTVVRVSINNQTPCASAEARCFVTITVSMLSSCANRASTQ